ncbi:MAG: prepilin-type N-terminal cleavage/methylation domain-containing protein [Armatimonadetes bacterium]|nr:prepilin-type N-terminal cleavage/methylation domain-containing protein [Armatimonadota bacterium]
MSLQALRRIRRASRGFTMIELVVVMMIIAILFFAVRPNVGGLLRGAQERTALRQLVGVFKVARTEALASGRLVRVVYSPEDGAFFAEVQSTPETDLSVFDVLPVLGRDSVKLPEHWEMTKLQIRGRLAATVSEPIYFYPDGHTDGVAMLFSDPDGGDTLVRLSSATGKPEFFDA